MAIKTSEEAKELIDKAMELSGEDISILKEVGDLGELSAIRLAGRLLMNPKTAYDKLSKLRQEGLVTNIQLSKKKREIFSPEAEQYFSLSDEGEEIVTILPLVEKVRGAL